MPALSTVLVSTTTTPHPQASTTQLFHRAHYPHLPPTEGTPPAQPHSGAQGTKEKKKLAGVLNRSVTLGDELKSLALAGLQEGEIQRRTDMVVRLQDAEI